MATYISRSTILAQFTRRKRYEGFADLDLNANSWRSKRTQFDAAEWSYLSSKAASDAYQAVGNGKHLSARILGVRLPQGLALSTRDACIFSD
jgi:hypothetical protein